MTTALHTLLEHAVRQRDEALNKIKAVGRAIGEPDPDKVVRAVQALARSTKAEA